MKWTVNEEKKQDCLKTGWVYKCKDNRVLYLADDDGGLVKITTKESCVPIGHRLTLFNRPEDYTPIGPLVFEED